MIIVIGDKIPTRVRGVLQIWLLEVKPNVFIGNVNRVIENRIIKFINPYLNTTTDIMIVRDKKSESQQMDIYYAQNTNNKLIYLNGLYFIQKRKNESE